jgi:hypothetical protein
MSIKFVKQAHLTESSMHFSYSTACFQFLSGPGTVFCDYLSYIFMFLSVATSNMVATSLAKKVHPLIPSQMLCASMLECYMN